MAASATNQPFSPESVVRRRRRLSCTTREAIIVITDDIGTCWTGSLASQRSLFIAEPADLRSMLPMPSGMLCTCRYHLVLSSNNIRLWRHSRDSRVGTTGCLPENTNNSQLAWHSLLPIGDLRRAHRAALTQVHTGPRPFVGLLFLAGAAEIASGYRTFVLPRYLHEGTRE
jgi:hypothetical protein